MKFVFFLKYRIVFNGSRKIVPEENPPPALILTLIVNQNLTLTVGQFSSGAIFRTPFLRYSIVSVCLQTNVS